MIGDRPADSVLELRFHHGPGRHLPAYEYQWQVLVGRRRYRIDFAYPDVKLAIEVDGYAFHDLAQDAVRQNELEALGWTVHRYTWADVCFDPSPVASEIIATLGALGYNFCC
jgi:very-short-patch-repair endonuclease